MTDIYIYIDKHTRDWYPQPHTHDANLRSTSSDFMVMPLRLDRTCFRNPFPEYNLLSYLRVPCVRVCVCVCARVRACTISRALRHEERHKCILACICTYTYTRTLPPSAPPHLPLPSASVSHFFRDLQLTPSFIQQLLHPGVRVTMIMREGGCHPGGESDNDGERR